MRNSGPLLDLDRRVGNNIAVYAANRGSELCRNCVRSPRKRWQTATFTGSHRDAFCGGKSLNGLREEVLRYYSLSVARIAFQACSLENAAVQETATHSRRCVAS
jgi:hypothetical protein